MKIGKIGNNNSVRIIKAGAQRFKESLKGLPRNEKRKRIEKEIIDKGIIDPSYKFAYVALAQIYLDEIKKEIESLDYSSYLSYKQIFNHTISIISTTLKSSSKGELSLSEKQKQTLKKLAQGIVFYLGIFSLAEGELKTALKWLKYSEFPDKEKVLEALQEGKISEGEKLLGPFYEKLKQKVSPPPPPTKPLSPPSSTIEEALTSIPGGVKEFIIGEDLLFPPDEKNKKTS